jgi:D-xylulose reductase
MRYGRIRADRQPKQEEGETRPEYSLRAAADLLLKTGTPIRGRGSIDLVNDATGAETCIQMGMNAVKPGQVIFLCVQLPS